jgi:hypothetical protein
MRVDSHSQVASPKGTGLQHSTNTPLWADLTRRDGKFLIPVTTIQRHRRPSSVLSIYGRFPKLDLVSRPLMECSGGGDQHKRLNSKNTGSANAN